MLFSKAQQQYLSDQMYRKARDIEVAIFNYLDGTMDNEFVLHALTGFWCKDGGFGHGLYIDNYNINSSPFQVYEAFRIINMVDLDSSCEFEVYDQIVNKAMNYLYNRAEIVDNKWNPNVLSNNDFAHSIEFEYNDANKKAFGYHPTAAILGYTLKLCKPTKAYYKKALKMIDIMLKDFYNMETLTKYEFISFNSFLQSIKELGLYKDLQPKIEAKLTKLAKDVVSLDFNELSAIHPLDCAFALEDKELKEMIDKELDFIISDVKSFGMWDYKGNWGYDKYPEADSAAIKWVGAISVNNYYILKKFGRLE